MPRSRPARKPREIDSREQKLQTRTAEIAVEGPATLEVEPLDVIEGPRFKDREQELAFMEEMLTIRIHTTTEKNAEQLIPVGVNGRMCYIPRGKDAAVRRKYVERLAHAREDNVQQDLTRQDESLNKLTITQAHKYPFSVIHDPNPKGADWLRKVLTD